MASTQEMQRRAKARKALDAVKTTDTLMALFISQQASIAKHFGMKCYALNDDICQHLLDAALELSKAKHSAQLHKDVVKLKSRHEHALAQKYNFDIGALYKPNYRALVATFTQDEQIALGYMDWLLPQLDPKFKGDNGYISPFKSIIGGGMFIDMSKMTAEQKKQVMAMV